MIIIPLYLLQDCPEYHVTQVVQMPWRTLMLTKTNKQLHAGHKSRSQVETDNEKVKPNRLLKGWTRLIDRSRAAGSTTPINDAAFGTGTGIYTVPQAGIFTINCIFLHCFVKVHTIAVPPSDASRVESVTLPS